MCSNQRQNPEPLHRGREIKDRYQRPVVQCRRAITAEEWSGRRSWQVRVTSLAGDDVRKLGAAGRTVCPKRPQPEIKPHGVPWLSTDFRLS